MRRRQRRTGGWGRLCGEADDGAGIAAAELARTCSIVSTAPTNRVRAAPGGWVDSYFGHDEQSYERKRPPEPRDVKRPWPALTSAWSGLSGSLACSSRARRAGEMIGAAQQTAGALMDGGHDVAEQVR